MNQDLRNAIDSQPISNEAQQKIADDASSEGSQKAPKVEVSGKYRMKACPSYAFRDDNTKKMRAFPECSPAKTGTHQATFYLEVTDGTDRVPKGARVIVNMPIYPGKIVLTQKEKLNLNDDEIKEKTKAVFIEKLANIMKFSKPYMVALTGEENIKVSADWFDEWIFPMFKEDADGKFKMVKDHKMTKEVMVTVEKKTWEGKSYWNPVGIAKAMPEDTSYSIEEKEEKPKENASAPPSGDRPAVDKKSEGETPENFSDINVDAGISKETDKGSGETQTADSGTKEAGETKSEDSSGTEKKDGLPEDF